MQWRREPRLRLAVAADGASIEPRWEAEVEGPVNEAGGV